MKPQVSAALGCQTTRNFGVVSLVLGQDRFDPFVVLLGQDGADEADDGVAAGEDADHVGPPADLFVQAFLGIVAPHLAPDLVREGC